MNLDVALNTKVTGTSLVSMVLNNKVWHAMAPFILWIKQNYVLYDVKNDGF